MAYEALVGIPNVQYTDDTHLVTGDIGVSQWTLRGTAVSGEHIEVRGCDFFTFADDGKNSQEEVILENSRSRMKPLAGTVLRSLVRE